MYYRYLVWPVLGLCWVQFARADTVVLRSGEHVQGQIVGESPEDVSIRRANKTGKIKYVDKIKRTEIARIERSPEQPAEPDSAAVEPQASRPAEAEMPSQKIADKPAFLETALRKYQKPDYAAAGLDLARLINTSTPVELQSLSKQAEEKVEMSLAELAAQAHFNAAIQRSKGRAVRFEYVTEYEKSYLIPLIEEEYQKTVTTPVTVTEAEGAAPAGNREVEDADRPGRRRDVDDDRRNRRNIRARPAEGRPLPDRQGGPLHELPDREVAKAEGGLEETKQPTSRPAMTVSAWLDKPEHFGGDKRESAAMAVRIYHASSLVAERLRLDPAVRKDAALRTELSKERGRLAALLKAVKARAGGALTPEEKQAMEAHMKNQMDAMRREHLRRNRDALSDLQMIIEEQQRPPTPPPGAPPAQNNADRKAEGE